MVLFSRKLLRQGLSRDYLDDLVTGNTAQPIYAGTYLFVMDPTKANLAFSGERAYERAWLRVGSADYRVASFNTGSGAFVTQQGLPSLGASVALSPSSSLFQQVASGADYEVHMLLSPDKKDNALALALGRMPFRQEVWMNQVLRQGIGSVNYLKIHTRDGFYPLDPTASGFIINDVYDVYTWDNEANALDLGDRRHFTQWRVVTTPTGPELEIAPAVSSTQPIYLDALVTYSLHSGDNATFNLPDQETLYWGAAAHCYWLLEQQTPGESVSTYKARRVEANRVFNLRASHLRGGASRKIRLDEAY